MSSFTLINNDFMNFLKSDTREFNLILTSPPYNIGKEYEKELSFEEYLNSQKEAIFLMASKLKPNGSFCYQVGNYVKDGEIHPLDIYLHQFFLEAGLKLRNRIIWRYGHGLHEKKRFSRRYEVIMWYTKGDDYVFNLDPIRIPSKYPGKKAYKGKNKGEYSGNPLGKNPEDVWDIPNVKSAHIEKTIHPCQFPVGLCERIILALTNKGDVVFDPYSGVGSTGCASILHEREYIGCEIKKEYHEIAQERLLSAQEGILRFRPHTEEIKDFSKYYMRKAS